MMETARKKISACFAAIILLFAMLIPNLGVSTAARATARSNAELFDETDVLEDLEKTNVNGNPFELKDYAFSADGKTSLFSFVEFCYSYTPDLCQDYGLYVYLHNPRGLKFDVSSARNTLSLRAGDDETAGYKKYHLDFLSVSTREDYEGLFYKFKVNLSSAQREEILSAVNSSERQYRISELEIMEIGKNEATLVGVGIKFYFSGYAGYYGPSGKSESTLTIRSEQADTLTLEKERGEIGFTVYRPDGSNGKNEFTQDSLHSVYFAVPNDFIETYGEMAGVHATWLNAVLNPILVTGNKDAYDAIKPFLGKTLEKNSLYGPYSPDLRYGYLGAYEHIQGTLGVSEIDYGFSYNAPTPNDTDAVYRKTKYGESLAALFLMIYSGAEPNSADSYTASSKELLDKMLSASVDLGGERVNEKYSKSLFASVDEAFTDINIKRSDTYDLTQEVISKSWWEKLFRIPGHVASSTVFNDIPAIENITVEKLAGSKEDVCDRLYIGEADYDNFKACYDTYKQDRSIYIIRYQVSDYTAQEAALVDHEAFMPDLISPDTNAYFFSETVNLDFDILDVTFSNGEKETVIPVAMSPVDFIPNATPPLEVHSDPVNKNLNILEIIIGLVLLVGIGIAIYYIVSLLVTEGKGHMKRRSRARRRK